MRISPDLSWFTVIALDAQNNMVPSYTGTVRFTSTDAAATVPADYTFTAGDAGVHHFYSLTTLRTAGSRTVTATDTMSAITGNFGITVVPGAINKFSVTAPAMANAGAAFTATVTAQDSSNNTITGYTGTVHFTSSDRAATLLADYVHFGSSDGAATLPGDYTFVAGDSGAHTFANGVTLRTAGSQTVHANDTGSPSIGGVGNVSVTSGSATQLMVYPTFGLTSVNVGELFSVSVIALDAQGNIATNYAGPVTFSSNDPQAQLPATYTFSPSEGGIHHFYSLFRLFTPGSQTVRGTDAVNAITEAFNITVAP